jgi:periplasmic protein TonB
MNTLAIAVPRELRDDASAPRLAPATAPTPSTPNLRPGHLGRPLQAPDLGQRSTGLIVVVAVHLAAGALLASGLAREAVNLVKKPLQMSLIPEVAPPPPPPPPKVERKIEPPKAQTPPPAYVPPPEVVPVAPAPPPPIVAVVAEPPPAAPAVIAPPPAPAPAPPPQPVAVKREIGLACPGYQAVLAQTLAEAYDRVGITGAVRTRFSVRGGQVQDVVPLSGPKEYFKYVQAAVKRMKCAAEGAEEVQVTLDVNFTS